MTKSEPDHQNMNHPLMTMLSSSAVTFLLSHSCHALAQAGKPFPRRRTAAVKRGPWYEDGLQFDCTGCGKCCKVDGDVWLAPEETETIMTHLGYSQSNNNDESYIEEFRKKYIRAEVTNGNQSESWMCLKRKEGACIFLDYAGQCSIYDVSPIQCSTYPFWPSIVQNRGTWEEESVLPDNIVIEEGSPARHWTPELGGCEGISTNHSGVDNNFGSNIIAKEEIELKKKAAKKHWKRFPVDEIKQTTWFL
jgi:Fe-S-cluster containining protein